MRILILVRLRLLGILGDIIDLDKNDISPINPQKEVSPKKSSKGKKPDVHTLENLKIYASRYQEWIKMGTLPSTSSGERPRLNPQLDDAPYACKSGGKSTSRSGILDKIEDVELRKLEISRMSSLYYFDPTIPFRLPEEGEALNSYSEDTIALSFETFRYVCSFPLPTIIWELCSFYDISPAQLSPHAWRLAAVAELMSHDFDIKLDMFDLFGSYKLNEIRQGGLYLRASSERG